MSETYESTWLAWLPLPFLLLGLYLAIGHLLQARLEWSRVYYAITNRRLLVQRGLLKPCIESLGLSEITYFSLHRQGLQHPERQPACPTPLSKRPFSPSWTAMIGTCLIGAAPDGPKRPIINDELLRDRAIQLRSAKSTSWPASMECSALSRLRPA